MRLGEYGRIEREISAAGNGTIYHRWRYGRRMLCDTEVTTPNGNFRHGVIEKIVRASGGKLTERELRARRQCGKAYPGRSQIRQALTDFETWNQLLDASFPPYDGEEDELPHNPLDTEELIKQHGTEESRRDEDSRYEEGGLYPRDECGTEAIIPRDTYGDSTPLHEVDRWADEELELAARHTGRAEKRRRYVDSLIKAVNGDLNVTLGEAERRLHGND
jgi:hypothetical protein